MTSTVHYNSDKQTWETPPHLFNELNTEFNFTLDACALPETAKCEQYFTPNDDALTQNWGGEGSVVWMNPPYGRQISKFMYKAKQEALNGATVVCLTAARTDTRWWWDVCTQGEIRFIKGRLKFVGAKHSAPFPSAIIVLHPYLTKQTTVWNEKLVNEEN